MGGTGNGEGVDGAYLHEGIKLKRNSRLWGEVREAVLQSVDCSQCNLQLTGMGGRRSQMQRKKR